MKKIEQNSLTFKIDRLPDECAGLPWQVSYMHGIVSEWTPRAKKPCERVLIKDGKAYFYYDIQASKAKALDQGWSVPASEGLSKKQIIAQAIEQDFLYLKSFCNDEWYYLGIVCTCLETGEKASLWGIESNSSEDYFLEVEQELIQELIKAFPAYLQREKGRLAKLQALLKAAS